MLKSVGHLLLALGICLSFSVQAYWEDARQVVERTTVEMLELLSDPAVQGEENFQQLFGGVNRVLSPVVDFEAVSRGVMGKYFRRASDAQHQRFAAVFQGTLVKTYARALSAFQLARYEVVPNRTGSERPDQQLVRVDVFAVDGTRYELAYFMVRNGSGNWQLTNVVIDGINLRQVFRNQFASALDQHGDIDTVIQRWASLVDQSDGSGR